MATLRVLGSKPYKMEEEPWGRRLVDAAYTEQL
jgi:hypothetical protein